MKRLFVIFICMFIAVASYSEVKFSMRMDYNEFLQYESLYVYIRLTNDSNYPYVINEDDPKNPSRIEFNVRKKGDTLGYLPKKHKRRLVIDNLKMMPDETRELMIDISKWYNFHEMGKYVISPVVYTENGAFEGKLIVVDIVYGARLTKISRRASGYYEGYRDYQLLYWKRNSLERIFLRVEDVGGQALSHGVVELGPLIRIVKPTLSVDRKGTVEVFHQSRPTTYLKTTFKSDYDGVTFVDQKPVHASVERSAKESVPDPRMELPPVNKPKKRSLFNW